MTSCHQHGGSIAVDSKEGSDTAGYDTAAARPEAPDLTALIGQAKILRVN
jgi:hypothetical protein